eukprot:CAMPEP_0183356070 /NCGR_PEP_ID=MMETSP0164_2-20130417/42973_1 /TAXON_ID=221442 /ORGANISM="Coccolithus pelagicus ssp braarudi, Strain PLY182g" /LENGTH=121 /DNA_ID=CAMNT_0025529373 /DNA_START=128 /DNA_END=490 /DNA_ORIENTATION=-
MPTNGSRLGRAVLNCATVACEYSTIGSEQLVCDSTIKGRQKVSCAKWKECHTTCSDLVVRAPTVANLQACWAKRCGGVRAPQMRKLLKCLKRECYDKASSFQEFWARRFCMWTEEYRLFKW